MLVISRQPDEWIQIGYAGMVLTGPIVVKALEFKKGRMRVGIDAPREVPVHRGEHFLNGELIPVEAVQSGFAPPEQRSSEVVDADLAHECSDECHRQCHCQSDG